MVMKIFENKKHVFWQAFFLTVLFFSIGLVLGIYLEQGRADNLNIAFSNSEAYLYDSFALKTLLENSNASCSNLNDVVASFADRIYEKALELEQFDESNQLTESVKAIHRKYDALRILLWLDIISLKTKCPKINTVIYLYDYSTGDVDIKASQIVWGRILGDLKTKKGKEVILIPIAADQNLFSLDYLRQRYGVSQTPAVIINEKNVIYDLKSSEDIKKLLNS